MTIPLQFVSLYDRQEVFVWSNCLLDLGTDFLVIKKRKEKRVCYLAVQDQFGCAQGLLCSGTGVLTD